MGWRTILILNNDNLDILSSDQDIGRKIYRAVLQKATRESVDLGPLGVVVEQSHADVAKLLVVGKDGTFGVEGLATLAYSHQDKNPILTLLTAAAAELGYDLIKKSDSV